MEKDKKKKGDTTRRISGIYGRQSTEDEAFKEFQRESTRYDFSRYHQLKVITATYVWIREKLKNLFGKRRKKHDHSSAEEKNKE